MNAKVRELPIAVISDLHLATHACKAKQLLKYLKSINPKKLVLNGDIIDSWRFSRNYFPKQHLKVVRQLIKMLEKGVEIIYITGNHDEFLRKLDQSQMGNLKIVNQLVLELDGKKTWIFHGDIFDHIIHRAKWLAKFGAAIYGLLTMINKFLNFFLRVIGQNDVIIYKSIKKKLVKDKPKVSSFEKAVGLAAARKDYRTVICGHTHVPKDKTIENEYGTVRYINCGDWVEHFTAAEYENGEWKLVYYNNQEDDTNHEDDLYIPDKKEVYSSLIKELALPN